jgi:hypothetical protein
MPISTGITSSSLNASKCPAVIHARRFIPMRTSPLLFLTCLTIPALPAAAQENRETIVYRVEFNIRDGSDTAAKTGRRYTMLIDANGKGNFRAGNKVPYLASSSPGQAAQYNYADIGVNIDARLRDMQGKVSLAADLDVSTVLPRDKATPPAPPNPTIASVRIGVNTIMIPGKPSLVASIDDPVTMRRFDVEATVTKVE